MSAARQPELIQYGIQNDESDIRCHVSPWSEWLIWFPTGLARAFMESTEALRYPLASARQAGIDFSTAEGRPIPWRVVPDVWRTDWPDTGPRPQEIHRDMDTSTKGRLAQCVVQAAMQCEDLEDLPLKKHWYKVVLGATENTQLRPQLKGKDLVSCASLRFPGSDHALDIQVKCDFPAGGTAAHRRLGCKGNVYLQVAELNPLKLH